MAPRTPPPEPTVADVATVDDVAPTENSIADLVAPAVDEPLALVTARYVGIEPVLAVIGGAQVIVQPGDPIPVTTEQLEQNPVFEVWED